MINQSTKIFTVWSDELEGILSPPFFISKPNNQEGFIKLKQIATVNPLRKKPTFTDDELVPYVGLPETSNREIQQVVMRPYKEVKGRNVIKKGDILFARIEPSVFNKKYIFVDDLRGNDFAFTSTEFYIVEPKETINPIFLFNMFFVDPIYNQVIGKTTGSTGRRRLDKGVFENIFIPFPRLSIQNDVAIKIQQAYEEKRIKEEEIKAVLAKIDSFVLSELGIEIERDREEIIFTITSDEIEGRIDPFFYKPFLHHLVEQIKRQKHFILGEAMIEMSGGATPKVTGDYYLEEGGIPFLRVQNITEMGINFDDVKFIKPDVHETMLKRSQLKKDDLVFTITGRIGSVAVVPDNFEGNINQHSVRFHLQDEFEKMKILPEYVASFFNTKVGRDLSFRYTTGGTRPALDYEALKSLTIPLPSIETQEKIISGVKSIYSKAKILRQEAESVITEAQKQVAKIIFTSGVE